MRKAAKFFIGLALLPACFAVTRVLVTMVAALRIDSVSRITDRSLRLDPSRGTG